MRRPYLEITVAKETKSVKFSCEGESSVCAHRVAWRFWGDHDIELTDELKEWMKSHAEERAKELIIEGYHSGELNYLHNPEIGEESEIRGWWEIL